MKINPFNDNHSFEHKKLESPIEEFFLNHFPKYLNRDTRLEIQYPISTISGSFRPDIALIQDGKVIIIECDGKEHHTEEKDDWYDEWRDAVILIQKKAETIYRLRGIDILNNINALIYIIYSNDPQIFREGYGERLVTYDIKSYMYKKHVYYDYYNEKGEVFPSMIEVKRKNINSGFDSFWLRYMMFSLLHPKININNLIEIFAKDHSDNKALIEKLNKIYPNLKLKDEKQLLIV